MLQHSLQNEGRQYRKPLRLKSFHPPDIAPRRSIAAPLSRRPGTTTQLVYGGSIGPMQKERQQTTLIFNPPFPRSHRGQFVQEGTHSLSQEVESSCRDHIATGQTTKVVVTDFYVEVLITRTLNKLWRQHIIDGQCICLQGMNRSDKGRSIGQYVTQPIGEYAVAP